MKTAVLVVCLLLSANVSAQQVKAYSVPAKPGSTQPVLRAPYPKECVDPDQRWNPTLQGVCRLAMQGHPVPSGTVVTLPASGSSEAVRLGYACISGLAMKRLSNGWEQVLDQQRKFVRCRPG